MGPGIHRMGMMNRLAEKCFSDCVDAFRSKEMTGAEEKVRQGSSTLAGGW